MHRPLKAAKLPPDIREWLDAELIRTEFSEHREIARALSARGYPMSHSSVYRYGQHLKQQMDAFTGWELPDINPTPELMAVAAALARVEIHRALLRRRLSELLDHQQS